MKKIFYLLAIILFVLILTGCNTCKETLGQCCKGLICSQSNVDCEKGNTPVWEGCSDKCVAQWTCVPETNSE